MTLHIVKTSPFATKDLELCLFYFTKGALLLIQDAVIATAGDYQWSQQLQKISKLYVLKEDLMARGLTALAGQEVDYLGFVELTIQHQQSCSW